MSLGSEALSRIQMLGVTLASTIDSQRVDASAFSHRAEALLLDAAPIVAPAMLDVADYLVTDAAVRQENHAFSDIPLMAYRHPQFCIEILHWLHATTSIHEHSFSGAFMVLAGSSLHTRYSIALRHRFDDDLAAVDATASGSERLHKGSVRRIDRGHEGLVHSLYHLESPSVSLVVRTYGERDQFSLLRPGLWFNELRLISDDRLKAVERLIHAADRIAPDQGVAILAQVADQVSDSRWMFLLMRQVRRFQTFEAFDALLAVRSRSSAALNEGLRAAYAPARVTEVIESARAGVAQADLRMFLALLLNVPSRADVFALAEEYAGGGEPAEVVADWLVSLSRFRGDPAQRLARIAAASAADFRLGVELKRALDVPHSDEEMRAALVQLLGGAPAVSVPTLAGDLAQRLCDIPALARLLA
jgi:hypothetical protein